MPLHLSTWILCYRERESCVPFSAPLLPLWLSACVLDWVLWKQTLRWRITCGVLLGNLFINKWGRKDCKEVRKVRLHRRAEGRSGRPEKLIHNVDATKASGNPTGDITLGETIPWGRGQFLVETKDVSSKHLIWPAAGGWSSQPWTSVWGIPKYPQYVFFFHFNVLAQLNCSKPCCSSVSSMFESFFVLDNKFFL